MQIHLHWQFLGLIDFFYIIFLGYYSLRLYDDIVDANINNFVAWLHTLFPLIIFFMFSSPYGTFLQKSLENIGLILIVLSFLSLNTSIRVLPAYNKVVNSGLYMCVRHPLYLGYIFLIVSKIIYSDHIYYILPLYLLLTYKRIELEEQILSKHKIYKNYKKSVKYKIIPFIW